MYTYVYVFFFGVRRMEKLIFLKDKFEREGNGVLLGLLVRVMDKSKVCLNCYLVFILRVCRVGD